MLPGGVPEEGDSVATTEEFIFALYMDMATPEQQRRAMEKLCEAGAVMGKIIDNPLVQLMCYLAVQAAKRRCEELARQRTN